MRFIRFYKNYMCSNIRDILLKNICYSLAITVLYILDILLKHGESSIMASMWVWLLIGLNITNIVLEPIVEFVRG